MSKRIVTESKNKTTKEFLLEYKALLLERRPCDVYRAMHIIKWRFRSRLKYEDKDKYERAASVLHVNALDRLQSAFCYHYPDKAKDYWTEQAMLTFDEHIELIDLAIGLPKQYCNDYSIWHHRT